MNRAPAARYRSRLLCAAAALLVLSLVFASYLRPDLAFNLANLVWSCF